MVVVVIIIMTLMELEIAKRHAEVPNIRIKNRKEKGCISVWTLVLMEQIVTSC